MIKGLLIEILSTQLEEFSGKSKKTGNDFNIRKQGAALHRPNEAYPDKFSVSLDKDQLPYAPGNYDIHPSSFGVNEYGSIIVKKLVLIPRVGEEHAKPPVNNLNQQK